MQLQRGYNILIFGIWTHLNFFTKVININDWKGLYLIKKGDYDKEFSDGNYLMSML